MRVLIISDIHANLTALTTVMEDAGEVDFIWCLGDLVGYGPDPNDCVEFIRGIPNLVCLLGNHDAAIIERLDTNSFNPEARLSIEWTQDQLSQENLDFLQNLPTRVVVENVTLVHGSPRNPTLEYLLDTYVATINFSFFDTSYCFVGHTHLPVQYTISNGQTAARLLIPQESHSFPLTPRSILNPGSVGQPRDRDPRAAYAIYNPDEDTWESRRIGYDIASVQTRMQTAGLPKRHFMRLTAGW